MNPTVGRSVVASREQDDAYASVLLFRRCVCVCVCVRARARVVFRGRGSTRQLKVCVCVCARVRGIGAGANPLAQVPEALDKTKISTSVCGRPCDL